ncbi:hypothetical protein GCM10009557_83730 [Virgisporangium ochraceum]|uniref:Uncharacterized protein n=1 Tax=Virgisporangium ochraceum TaxID=65505 RepID=A0A8J4EF99_9ACTN|nr:hypothetical protein [Virgisporangium ochraceum]GIJ72448.1 hypothetical protein Voc01_073650 [Virgisporangium ochraceum]
MPHSPRTDPIALDCDVLVGAWPPRADLDLSPETTATTLARAGIAGALVCSGRGAWFDDRGGNDETIAACATQGWLPAGTIDLRNALNAEAELDRLVRNDVRAVRLFGPLQGCEPGFPGYSHVIDAAVRRRMVLLVEGDLRLLWRGFAGRGATVVFLDAHAYHVADFVLAARAEPGFLASTRLLNAPDSIERVVGEVGSARLVFGSRTPVSDTSPAVLRMRRARLSAADWAAVTGGTLTAALRR